MSMYGENRYSLVYEVNRSIIFILASATPIMIDPSMRMRFLEFSYEATTRTRPRMNIILCWWRIYRLLGDLDFAILDSLLINLV